MIKSIRSKRLGLVVGLIGIIVITLSVLIGLMFKTKEIMVNLDGKDSVVSTNKFSTRSFVDELTNMEKMYESTSGSSLVNGAKVTVNTKKYIKLKLADKGKEYKEYETYTSNLRDLLDEVNQKENTVSNETGKYLNLKYMNKESEVLVKDLDKLDLVLYKVVKSKDEVVDKYNVKYLSTTKVPAGKEKVKAEGKNGKYLDEVTKVYINGKLVDTKSKRLKTIVKKQTKVIEKGIVKQTTPKATGSSTGLYSLAQFMQKGVVNWGGYKFTYYSQSVLPGGGLKIPGRHVSAAGYVCDKDGYIVLASSAPKGSVFPTPFGASGKVYDRGVSGNHLDVYIR